MEVDRGLKGIKDDLLFKKIFELCLLCGQCTFKCPTNASIRDIVMKAREGQRSRVIAPALFYILSHPKLYQFVIKFLGRTQRIWCNQLSRRIFSILPQGLLLTSIPYQRYLPELSKSGLQNRFPELVNIPASQADIAYFYGCSSDLLAEPIAESFINIARHNNWRLSLPPQCCCGEPFGAQGSIEEYHRLARYNLDQLLDYKYIIAHCPSCIYGMKEYANDFAKVNDKVYEEKARELAEKLYDPGRFMMEVIGADKLRPRTRDLKQKVTVHLSCHEKLGQKMTATANYTRDLLHLIPRLEIVEMQEANECCGLGGPWGLGRHYDLALKLRQDKIRNIIESQADIVTSWCLGCMLQMRDGLIRVESTSKVRHPLELLSDAYGQYNA
jgi:glycolate oxidase iron-sulfur subunit